MSATLDTLESDRSPHVVTYTAAGPIRATDPRHVPAFWRLARDMWASRDLIVRLVRRDVQSRYRQFFLGPLWVVLQPAITISVFLVMNNTGVLNVGAVPVPYPLFALVGITIWQLFVSGVTQGMGSLASAGPLLIKLNVSKAALVVAALGTALVDFAVRIGVIVLLYAIYQLHPSLNGLLAIPALLPLLVLTVTLALILALMGVFVRDITGLVPTALALFVFLMPIYYETPASRAFAQFNKWNPLYHLVCGPRDLLLRGELAYPAGFALSTLGAVLLFVFSARLFLAAQYKIAERA